MFVFALQVQLSHPYVTSLKEKRKITHSLIKRLSQKFNLSVMEINNRDELKFSSYKMAGVSPSLNSIHNKKDAIILWIEANYAVEILESYLEVF